jgi:peptide/nickel transport system permease protein
MRTAWLSRKATVGLVIIGIFAFLAVFGPILSPYDPSANTPDLLQAPSAAHLLGTTQLGQDVLSQVLTGARSSIVTAVLAAVIATVLSVIVGVSSGYLAGAGGELLSALSNVFLVIPALPLVIVLAGYLHGGGTIEVALVISVTGWAFGARVLRAQTLSLRRRDFVSAARAVGERPLRIIVREIIPQVLPIIASGFLLTIIFAIITQASLAFLGLVNISEWSWGTMLYWTQSAQAFTQGAWWWFVPPGLCIALLGMGLALLNFSIDELVNPRLRAPHRRRPRTARLWKRDSGQPAVPADSAPSRGTSPAGAPVLPSGTAMAARGLEVTYGEGNHAVRAVRDIDIALKRGKVLGIAGESGCGKSTMAFAMARLLQDPGRVTAGSTWFAPAGGSPVDVLSLKGEELRRFRAEKLALVPQAALNALNPVLTIGAQLRDLAVDHRGRREWEQLSKRREEVLKLVGLSQEILRSYPHELSGGMRQRVMIAMAILLDPDVIIMDEPTTALDVVTQRQIIERLLALQRQLDLTVAFITHDMSLLLEIADDIAIMYAGQIVEYGPAEKIKKNPMHPYTQGLLASFPPLTPASRELTGIPGSPPDMGNVPPGCAFAPRCPHAWDKCRAEVPRLERGDNREVACWLHEGTEKPRLSGVAGSDAKDQP